MKRTRIVQVIPRVLVGIVGLFLLALIFQRWNPWHLRNVSLEGTPTEYIRFHISLLSISFQVTRGTFLILIFFVVPLALLGFRASRESLTHLFANKTSFGLVLVSASCLVLSMVPGFFLNIWYEEPVALYLFLSMYAVLFLAIGLHALLPDLSPLIRICQRILSTKLVWFLSTLFCGEFILTNWISYAVFDHMPHVQDSIAQVFHGTIFAMGKLTVPSPPLKEFFQLTNIINNGQWYSQYPPGHSFLLMFGVLIGAPWIINPLLGSATILGLYYLGKELYSDHIGRLSALLGLLSPFLLFMSSEYMNHASVLFMFVLFALFYAKAMRLKTIGPAILAGASLGFMFLTRPLSAAAIAVPYSVYGILLLRRAFRTYAASFLSMIILVLMFVGIFLVFNLETNGSPFVSGYQALWGDKVLPGLGTGLWDDHSIGRGIRQTLSNVVALNQYLFEWPIPSLLLVFVLFASGKINRWDLMMLAAFMSVMAAYAFYWYQDWCFGPRYLYDAVGAIIVLSARGIERIPYLMRIVLHREVRVKRVFGLTTAILLLCVGFALTSNVPALVKHYGQSYWMVNGKVLEEVRSKGIHRAIIFTRSYYGSVFLANSPKLDNDVIFVRDRNKDNILMAQRYPGYRYYLADENHVEEIFFK